MFSNPNSVSNLNQTSKVMNAIPEEDDDHDIATVPKLKHQMVKMKMARDKFKKMKLATKLSVGRFLIGQQSGIAEIGKLEKYALKHLMFSTPFDQLLAGSINRTRMAIVLALAIYGLVWSLRIALYAKTGNSPSLAAVTGDWTPILGPDRVGVIMKFTVLIATVFLIKLEFNYLEIRLKSPFLKHLNELKQGQRCGLLPAKYRKFRVMAKLTYMIIANGLAQFSILVMVLGNSFVMIVAYTKGKIQYEPITYVLSGVGFNICLIHLMQIGLVSACIGFLSTTYLNYRFCQVADDLAAEASRQKVNIKWVMKSVVEHFQVSEITAKYNGWYNRCFFLMYFGLTTAININLINMIYTKNPFLHHYSMNANVTLIAIVVSLFFLCSSLSHQAHRPYKHVCAVLARAEMSLGQRIKLMNFAERLTSHVIGFYCFNLFPFDNYHLYQYFMFGGCSFFLLLNLLVKVNN